LKDARTLVHFFGAERACILGSALHIIQITWFTNVFGNFCRMQLRPSDIVVSIGILRLF